MARKVIVGDRPAGVYHLNLQVPSSFFELLSMSLSCHSFLRRREEFFSDGRQVFSAQKV